MAGRNPRPFQASRPAGSRVEICGPSSPRADREGRKEEQQDYKMWLAMV